MPTRFIVWHWEERGDAESGPLGVVEVGDEEFGTKEEAQAWVAKQKNPNWYEIARVEMDHDDYH